MVLIFKFESFRETRKLTIHLRINIRRFIKNRTAIDFKLFLTILFDIYID